MSTLDLCLVMDVYISKLVSGYTRVGLHFVLKVFADDVGVGIKATRGGRDRLQGWYVTVATILTRGDGVSKLRAQARRIDAAMGILMFLFAALLYIDYL